MVNRENKTHLETIRELINMKNYRRTTKMADRTGNYWKSITKVQRKHRENMTVISVNLVSSKVY